MHIRVQVLGIAWVLILVLTFNLGMNEPIFLMVGDMTISSEKHTVVLLIYEFASQTLDGVHRNRM